MGADYFYGCGHPIVDETELSRLRMENDGLRRSLKASDLQHIRLRAGLREAIEWLESWIKSEYEGTGLLNTSMSQLDDLRKLLGGEP